MSKMDQLMSHFQEKTPVYFLYEYRQLMRYFGNCFINFLSEQFSSRTSEIEQHVGRTLKNTFLSGSMAEGCSLARIFSPDTSIHSEVETDYMIRHTEFETELYSNIVYVRDNKVFVHIPIESELAEQATSYLASRVGNIGQQVFARKEDGTYMSSLFLKFACKEVFNQVPNLGNNSFWPTVAFKHCEAGSAAATIHADDLGEEDFATAKAQHDAREKAARDKMMKAMIPCDEFEVRSTEMFAHLDRVQDEFMEMRRSGETSVSLFEHTSKALEWAMTCVDIIDFLFDTLQTTLPMLDGYLGMNSIAMNEENRIKMKQTLKIYVDQLMISEDSVSETSTAAAIGYLLSVIEREYIAPKRYSTACRELLGRLTSWLKILSYVDQNSEALSRAWKTLPQTGGIFKRMSFDMVPCMKLSFWPSVAAGWKTRDRAWPDQSIIEGIVSRGVHLLHKAFCHDDIDWRLSFSGAEIELATRWSPVQLFVYFAFKSLFYKFIKPLDKAEETGADASPNKKYLASYTAKTVMMWTSESVDESWWTEENAAECLTILLFTLQSALECRTLHHYFVSSVNLLEGLPDALATRVTATVDCILDDPAAVADQLEEHFEKMQLFVNDLPAHKKLWNDFQDLLCTISNFIRVHPE